MKTPAGAARGMASPAPLPKRSCLNEDAQTGEHKGSAVRFTRNRERQAKRINRPHAGPSWTRAVIFTAMCMRSGIGNPLRIGGGSVRRVAEMAENGKEFKLQFPESRIVK